jgi:DeoR family transcriptional regulator, catabolite repression regulator
VTQLNPNHIAILRAIKEGKTDTYEISEFTKLSVNIVRYYQMEMKEEGFVKCTDYFSRDDTGSKDHSCYLEPKGEVALENPDYLLQSNQVNRNQTNIYAQTIGFVNSGDGTVTNFSQNIGQRIDEINHIINSIRKSAETFPEEQCEEVLLSLEDLESDLSQPDKIQPKRIQRRIAALWAVACILGTSVAGITGFSNDILELAEKLGVPIELKHN